MVSLNDFRDFAIQNINAVFHPTANKSRQLSDVSVLSDLLYAFLEYEIDYPDTRRLKSNFDSGFATIFNFSLEQMPSALEALATNFEVFLRKIAYCKYYNTIYWEGDEQRRGIVHSSLFNLISGILPLKDDIKDSNRQWKLPELLVGSGSIDVALLDFVRDNLRNAVHHARTYSRLDLVRYSNFSITVYLMAVEANKVLLQELLSPVLGYIKNVLDKGNRNKLNERLIQISGTEMPHLFNHLAVEKLYNENFLPMPKGSQLNEDDRLIGQAASMAPRIDSVFNISKQVNRFVLIGQPGAGKTCSLLNVENLYAKTFDINDTLSCVPIYLTALSFSKEKSFLDLIKFRLGDCIIEELIRKYKVVILIDGFNEVDESLMRTASEDLKLLMEEYPAVSFIISARSFSFTNYWNLPVFQLNALNESQIEEIVTKAIPDTASLLCAEIFTRPGIVDISRTPLFLMMLIEVFESQGKTLPDNKGMLFDSFVDGHFRWEKRLYLTDTSTKKDLLSFVAFEMRKRGLFRKASIDLIKSLFEKALSFIDRSIGVNRMFNEILDNHIFSTSGDYVEYFHETYQEYFVALEIKKKFLSASVLDFDYKEDKWLEPLIMCAQLLTNSEDRFHFLEFLFVGPKTGLNKRLEHLNKDDVDENFPVACKIAFELKDTHPDLYKRIEMYLNNYLTIWSARISKGVEITTYAQLIRSAALLSSPLIFRRIFTQIRFVYWWFYDECFEKEFVEYEDDLNYGKFHKRYKFYCHLFIDNVSDLLLAYTIIDEESIPLFNTFHSQPLRFHLKGFRNFILQNASEIKLIDAFERYKDERVLHILARLNPDFYFENVHKVYSEPERIYTFVLFNFKQAPFAHKMLAEGLNLTTLSHKLRMKICRLLAKHAVYQTNILKYISENLESPTFISNVQKVRELIRELPMSVLKQYNVDTIFKKPEILTHRLNAQVISFDRDSREAIIKIPRESLSQKIILSNLHSIFFQNLQLKCSIITNYPGANINLQSILIDETSKNIQFIIAEHCTGGICKLEYYEDGTDELIGYDLAFTSIVRSSLSGNVHILFNDDLPEHITKLNAPHQTIKVVFPSGLSCNFLRISNYWQQSVFLRTEIPDAFDIVDQLDFTMTEVKLQIGQPSVHHVEDITSNHAFLNYIEYNKSIESVASFKAYFGL